MGINKVGIDKVGRYQLSMQFQVLKEIFFLGLGLTVTEINIKKVQKQDLKKPKRI